MVFELKIQESGSYLSLGAKNPDCLLTDGPGWKNLGK
jgi:hypothetical protein